MKWLILVVGLVVVCFVAALVLGLVRGGGMGAPTSSMRHEPLPDTPLTEEDLDGLQLDVTARGYRMGEVDAVIDRLRRELREKDEQIAVLRRDVERVPAGDAAGAPAPAVSPETAVPPEPDAPSVPGETAAPAQPATAPERPGA